MDFIVTRFIKMLTESYHLKCEYIREQDKAILIIKHLDSDTKKFITGITCNVVTGCMIERNKSGEIVKQYYSREDKRIAQDFGPGSVRIFFDYNNYGIRVNTLDARLREYFTSDKSMEAFYRKANSL